MIAINVQGGLGNQLFEYAFAYAAARKLNTHFVLDNSKTFIVPNYFMISQFDTKINKFPYLRRLYRNQVLALKKSKYIDSTDCRLDPNPVLQNHAYYDGFFQSINCFESYEFQIRKLFTIRDQYVRDFDAKYGDIFRDKKTIVMHIRRGDYLTHGVGKNLGSDDVSLPCEYYISALANIPNIEQYQIIVVGDDIEWEKQQFASLPQVQFAYNSMIIDFQLMMNADVVICSNGSFAWWAAYLNQKPHKRIIAPKYFLGYQVQQEYPKDIYAKTHFEQIEVLK